MRTTIAASIAALALAVPAASQAASQHATPCKPATPTLVSSLGVMGGVSCATARSVERYWERQREFWTRTVRINGVRWVYLHWGSVKRGPGANGYPLPKFAQFTVGQPRWPAGPTIEIVSKG
jgi:hypothetical protein